MKLKNIIKSVFAIIIIFLSLGISISPALADGGIKAKMDISQFTYGITPFGDSIINPIVAIGIDAGADANYDPRFNIANLDGVRFSDDIPALEKKAKAKVFPYINGSMFYKIELLEKIIANDLEGKAFAQTIINLTKQYTWLNEDQRLNSYFLFPSNYQYFLLEKEKIVNNPSMAITAILNSITNPVYFFPGISYQSPLEDKVFPDNVINELKTALNIKDNSSNKFYYNIDNIKKLANLSFGACYKINPAGQKNSCYNTSKQNCTQYGTEKIKPADQKNLYFLHGISCEKVDLLLNNPSSRTETQTKTTEKAQYYMLLYFHGYFMEGIPDKYTTITAEQTESRFAEKVFNTDAMKKLQPNYITVWVNEINKAFNNASTNWGTVPFDDIINKSYEFCKNDSNKGNATWDKTKKITIGTNFTATINCGYNPNTANVPQTNLKVIAAGHSSGGTVINQALKNNNIYFSVLLDALYYKPASEASTCTKWNAIQANMTGEKTAISDGQPQLTAWKTLCPNGITAGSTTAHDDIIKDLPNHLSKKFPLSTTSVQEQLPQEQIPDAPLKEKTIFEPQVKFGGITSGINLPEYINLMYKYLVTFALVVTGFIIVLGGAKYMLGQNDGIPMIRNAFIGFILLSSTYVILKTVNPAAINMDIIEISEIGRNTITGTSSAASTTGSTISGPTTAAGEDRSPDPPIAIGNNWYFPVRIDHVNVSGFKYNATNGKAAGSFGYYRRTNVHSAKTDTPIACHHAVDIYTTAGNESVEARGNETYGEVFAITDGEVVLAGNTFHHCQTGSIKKDEYKFVGSIIIKHKDINGNIFYARYGEINVNCYGAPGNSKDDCYRKISETQKTQTYNPNLPVVNLKTLFPPGTKITAGQPLGVATYCGMLHFEIHAKPTINVKWRLPQNLYTTLLKELNLPDNNKPSYANCLASPSAVQYLKKDTGANHGTDLRNPSSFLIELWNQTGAQGKQKTE